jgi:4-amino-4-deoxy-L-arabinose transferase-like glycosyltransferase
VTRSEVGTSTDEARSTSVLPSGLSRYVCYALLLLTIGFFAFIRYRLRAMPLERDEGEYAYGGQLILQGFPLYDLVYTVKLPGTHAAYALMLALLGQSQGRIHIGLIFVNAATTLLVFLLCTRWFGRFAGLIAAATYSLLSTGSSVTGFAAHATHFVVLFALAGAWVLLKAIEADRNWLFFSSGVLFGIAFLMKQPGICFLLWAIVLVMWRGLKHPARRSNLAMQIAAVLSGAILPFALTCLMIWRSGTFQKFWFWTFSYAREYGTNLGLTEGRTFLTHSSTLAMRPAAGIWIMAFAGLTTFLWSARAREQAFAVISLVLFSCLALSAGLYFRPHYFILLLPAVSILAGLAVSCGTERLQSWKLSPVLIAIPSFLFVLSFYTAVYNQRQLFFEMNAVQACEQTYWPNPFPEILEISNYINRTAPASAKIAVIGSEPEVYFYTHRRSATGYVYFYPLLEPQKYVGTMQEEMEAEIERSRPEIIVLVNNPKSWVAWSKAASTDEIFAWAAKYLAQYYEVVGLAESDETTTKFYWEAEAEDHQPSSPSQIYVLRRKY